MGDQVIVDRSAQEICHENANAAATARAQIDDMVMSDGPAAAPPV